MTVVLDTTTPTQASAKPNNVDRPAMPTMRVSVNGTAIAHDAIVREMQHHPAKQPMRPGSRRRVRSPSANCCCSGRTISA